MKINANALRFDCGCDEIFTVNVMGENCTLTSISQSEIDTITLDENTFIVWSTCNPYDVFDWEVSPIQKSPDNELVCIILVNWLNDNAYKYFVDDYDLDD